MDDAGKPTTAATEQASAAGKLASADSKVGSAGGTLASADSEVHGTDGEAVKPTGQVSANGADDDDTADKSLLGDGGTKVKITETPTGHHWPEAAAAASPPATQGLPRRAGIEKVDRHMAIDDGVHIMKSILDSLYNKNGVSQDQVTLSLEEMLSKEYDGTSVTEGTDAESDGEEGQPREELDYSMHEQRTDIESAAKKKFQVPLNSGLGKKFDRIMKKRVKDYEEYKTKCNADKNAAFQDWLKKEWSQYKDIGTPSRCLQPQSYDHHPPTHVYHKYCSTSDKDKAVVTLASNASGHIKHSKTPTST